MWRRHGTTGEKIAPLAVENGVVDLWSEGPPLKLILTRKFEGICTMRNVMSGSEPTPNPSQEGIIPASAEKIPILGGVKGG